MCHSLIVAVYYFCETDQAIIKVVVNNEHQLFDHCLFSAVHLSNETCHYWLW